MKIGGFQTQSTVDYPGRLAAVVFTAGCNLNCSYCHNHRLIEERGVESFHDPEQVLATLRRRRRFLDGVVISGGEPTLQPDLDVFLRRIREMGYSIKLDTNGTRPWVIESLIDQGLVDFVAMDVKAPLSRYAEICRADVDVADVQASILLLLQERVDYEFRTTLAPELTRMDLDVMRWMVLGARSHVLQNCRTLEEWRGEQAAQAPPAQASGTFAGLSLERLRDQIASLPAMRGRLTFRGLGFADANPAGAPTPRGRPGMHASTA